MRFDIGDCGHFIFRSRLAKRRERHQTNTDQRHYLEHDFFLVSFRSESTHGFVIVTSCCNVKSSNVSLGTFTWSPLVMISDPAPAPPPTAAPIPAPLPPPAMAPMIVPTAAPPI